MMSLFVASFVSVVGFASEVTPTRCSVATLRNNPDGYEWPVPRVIGFVRDADVIVYVRADGVVPTEQARSIINPHGTSIVFTVLEQVRGEAPATLRVPGYAVEQDDYNRGAVPYQMVRPLGQRGNCFATGYKLGGEYVLILRNSSGGLTPYWAPLAPLNEQIRGPEMTLGLRGSVRARSSDASGDS